MFKTKSKTLIRFDKVSFGYEPKKLILSNVSFSIEKNEHVCIIGANGCGKSTVAKMLVGLFKPRSGSIIFNNKVIDKTNVRTLKNQTGIVFENPDNQFIGLTAQDDIAFGLENQCVPHNKMQTIINNVAKYVDVIDLLKSSVKDLSGGQKQLVAIASVLAMNPELIVFDEATSMLDAQAKNKINNLISSLLTKKHKTIVTITHDMDEAAKADKIIVMSKSKVAMVGSPKQIFSSNKLKGLSLDKPIAYKLGRM